MEPDKEPKENFDGQEGAELNIVPATEGSIVNKGSRRSPNYSRGVSGWIIRSDGTAEFMGVTVNGSDVANQDIFGDGSDGDATISGSSTLTADKYYDNLTLNDGATLNPGGYRIFVKGTLTRLGTGKIARNGNNGSNGSNGSGTNSGGTGGAGGSGGVALASGSIFGSVAGASGSAGGKGDSGSNDGGNGVSGNAGDSVSAGLGAVAAVGAVGGSGGTGIGTGGSGGTAGAAGSFTAAIYKPRTSSLLTSFHQFNGTSLDYFRGNGQNGGSSGGGSGGNQTATAKFGGTGGGGGGNGSDGGCVLVCAKNLALTNNNAFIQANGGNGGNGGNGADGDGGGTTGGGGSGAGGSAGSGGVIGLIYSSIVSGSITSGELQVSSGSAGTAGTPGSGNSQGNTGANGKPGNTGITITLQV